MKKMLITALLAIAFVQSASAYSFSGPGSGLNVSTTLTTSNLSNWAQIQTAGITVTLPASASISAGQTTTLIGTNQAAIAPNGTDTICAYKNTSCSSTAIPLWAGEIMTLTYNGGGQWYVTSDQTNGHISTAASAFPPDIGGSQNPIYYNLITADTVQAGSGFLLGNETRMLWGTPTSTGGRIANYTYMQQNSATSSSTGNRNYVGVDSEQITSTGDGGTNTTTNALGAYFAYAADARMNTGATNLLELTGAEIDILTQAGSSAKYTIGWSLVNNETVQGTGLDAGLEFGANNLQGDGHATVGWNVGIVFSDMNGVSPVNGNTTLFEGSFPTVGTQTIGNGIYLNAFSCTNTCFSSNGFSVNGSGAISTPGIIGGSGSLASSNYVGAYFHNQTTGTSLTAGLTANATSLTLGPGDYDVECTVQFVPAASTTVNTLQVGINTASATMPGFPGQVILNLPFVTGNSQYMVTPTVEEALTASSTTLYCPVLTAFGTSTMMVNGSIRARRMH
ncbi:hypothetical protein [Paraburkholderia sediminicola]|uniref:hypothetical protein n=1 Tax=Paraburkholderia sediminicola TaxID=458836 RepID=UPI0038B8E29B